MKPAPHYLSADETDQLSASRWLTHLALVVALALVAARAMTMEMLRDVFEPAPGGQTFPRGAGAASSMILDAAMMLPALLVLLRGAIDRRFVVRFTAAHALMFALAAVIVASTLWASDKFAAAVTASHWLAGVSIAWAVSQVVRDAARLRLVAGLAAGILLVYVAHGAIYRFIEVPDNQRDFQARKATIFAASGWDPESFLAKQFERKVMNGDLVGLAASPNTYAAVVVMLGIVVAGVQLQRISNRDETSRASVMAGLEVSVLIWLMHKFANVYFYYWGPFAVGLAFITPIHFGGFLAALVAIGMGALLLADSRTAFATPFIAAGMLFVLARFGTMFAAHRKAVFFRSIALSVVVTGAIIGHGLFHGTLFHDSLTFRWKYWVGAFAVFKEHPILGVGWSNFGGHYLAHRLLDAPEEIKDPHNFVVRCFTELGIVGGLLMLMWQARLWWELSFTRRSREGADASLLDARSVSSVLPPITITVILAIGINLIASLDMSQNSGYVFIETLKRFLFGGLILIGAAVVSVRSSTVQEVDDRPAPWLERGVLVAIAIFLIHNLIDFQLAEVGPMLIFMLLVGAASGVRGRDDPLQSVGIKTPSATKPRLALAAASSLWFAFAFGLAAPVALAERASTVGDEYVRTNRFGEAAVAYRNAFDVLWIPNAEYAYRGARALLFDRADTAAIRRTLDNAIAADPTYAKPLKMRAQFNLTQQTPDIASIRADYDMLLKLNPNDVDTRLEYARNVLENFNLRAEAVEQYREALRYNAGLSPDEPKRLTSDQVAGINTRIAALSVRQ